jgi:hypothetical protein
MHRYIRTIIVAAFHAVEQNETPQRPCTKGKANLCIRARNLHLEPRENSKEMGLCREGWMYAKGSMHIHPKKAYYTMYGSSLDEEMCGCRYREDGK